jgi:hypothetical protein
MVALGEDQVPLLAEIIVLRLQAQALNPVVEGFVLGHGAKVSIGARAVADGPFYPHPPVDGAVNGS